MTVSEDTVIIEDPEAKFSKLLYQKNLNKGTAFNELRWCLSLLTVLAVLRAES